MKKRGIFLCVLLFCLAASAARSDESVVIRFGLIRDVPPFSYEKNAQIMGVDYEIFLELQRRLKFKSHLKLFPFKRLLEYAQRGSVDVVLQLYRTPGRESYLLYSAIPSRWDEQYVFVPLKNRQRFNGFGIRALYGKRVGKDRGFFITREFERAVSEDYFQLDEAGTTAANIKKMLHGRLDCFISAYHIAVATAEQLGVGDRIAHLPKPIAPKKGVFIALSKGGKRIPDKHAFLEQINAALENMHADGTLSGIEALFLE